MRQSKSPLRGSVTQNTASMRVRVREQPSGLGFLTRLGLLLGLLLIAALAITASWRAGWPQRKIAQLQEGAIHLSQKMHFAVKDIVVDGRKQSNREEVFDALGTARGAPIFALNVEESATRIGKLPWVDSAVVERRLPDTVAVLLTERVPAARWQRDEKTSVIDAEGHLLPSAKAEDFSNLPLVVGAGAEREAQSLFALLKDYPDIKQKLSSAVRVGERRWDLHFMPKITVRLPELDADKAVRRLSVLIVQEKILERDIVAVDLRLPDRLVIEPSAEAKPTGDRPQ